MPSYRLVAKVDRGPDQSFLVRSPAVGVADGVPARGVILNPSEGFLTLTILGRRYLVQLPRNVHGMVTEQLIDDNLTPLGYGQPLFRLGPVRELGTRGPNDVKGSPAEQAPSDMVAVTAPSDGVFHRKPAPDSPCYVQEGSEVSTGSVLGLVEVMKSFTQIAYGGPGVPERGIVAEIPVEDAAEVAFGQTLFLVRPG